MAVARVQRMAFGGRLWSRTAAAVVFVVGVTVYIVLAVRYLRRHPPPPAA
jgi:hypothetical protein